MADFKKTKQINILTPTGIAVWPKLNAPDTKFKAGGEFKVGLRLSAEQAQPLIDKFEAELAYYFDSEKAELMQGDGKSKAKAKALKLATDKPYKMEVDDEGDETGNIVFNFKMPNRIPREGKADIVLFPDFFDAGGKSLKNPPEVWGGSKLRISGQLRPFNMALTGVGLSLRLQAVQIIELTTKGSRDATGYGFGAEEGYEGNEMPTDDSSTAAADDTDAPVAANPDF